MAGERSLRFENLPPQSIRLWGKWRSYKRVDPFATVLATTIDLVTNILGFTGGDKNVGEAIDDFMDHTLAQGRDKTFLQGMGDIMELIESDDEQKAIRWASNFAASWVPNILRNTARAVDPVHRESRVFKDEFWKNTAKRTIQKALPLPAFLDAVNLKGAPKRHPLWGYEISRVEMNGPKYLTDFPYRVLSPIRLKPVISGRDPMMTKIDRSILNWNLQNPEATMYRGWPSSTFQRNNKKINMTEAEHDLFLKRSGEIAFGRLQNNEGLKDLDPMNPKIGEMKLIDKHISDAREIAKNELVQKRAAP